ncbi:hypothetical protein HPB48_023514 [Haemaphysalis longicornis]|uniref:CCHC-type domain-containing protein n=1 Tax=Haemaphysalis longicornis TaxID=44386 RepID=A0A9J6H7K9_HAELO|nr:hypothetical protein HPB48_023514 [Haemaphysalis longicornis]
MSVVIAFEGPTVQNYVKECSLYRKQIDMCYQCGRLGHRMNVCPNPTNRICHGCNVQNPDAIHKCKPKCNLCGSDHLTADKECKPMYKAPYVVRKRRWERQKAKEESPPWCDGSSSGRRGRSLTKRGISASATRSDSRVTATAGDATATGSGPANASWIRGPSRRPSGTSPRNRWAGGWASRRSYQQQLPFPPPHSSYHPS